jgi:hypothetical protein
MTTVVHPDPLRELQEANQAFKAKLKKMASTDRADLEALQRFARAHSFMIPSLALLGNEANPSDSPNRATLRP